MFIAACSLSLNISEAFNCQPLTLPVWCWADDFTVKSVSCCSSDLPLINHRSGSRPSGISSFLPERLELLSTAEGGILAEDVTQRDLCRNLKTANKNRGQRSAEDSSRTRLPIQQEWRLTDLEECQILCLSQNFHSGIKAFLKSSPSWFWIQRVWSSMTDAWQEGQPFDLRLIALCYSNTQDYVKTAHESQHTNEWTGFHCPATMLDSIYSFYSAQLRIHC